MGGYGYTSTSNRGPGSQRSKTEEPLGPAIRKPFVPFVPNPNRNPQEYVTRSKTVVPIATGRSYGDEYSSTRVSPTTPRDDGDEYWIRQTVHAPPPKVNDFLSKIQNEASRPPRSTPALTADWRASPHSSVGYADYANREHHRAIGTPRSNDKERHKPIGISSIGDRNDSYDRPNRLYGNGWSRPNASSTWSSFYDNGYGAPKNSSGWTAPPRNGAQLSNPTNDIGKASGLLKQVARVNDYDDYGNKLGRPTDEGYNYNFQRRKDEVDRPNPSIWAEPPGNEPSQTDGTTPRKDDYYYTEPVDTTYDATRRYGIFNFKSRLRARQF